MFRITSIIIFFFVAVSANAADYSKCAEFFNNNDSEEGNPKGYRTKNSGPFVPKRLRYIPFHLMADGSIALHKGATMEEEITRADRVGRQIITHQSPTIESLETLDPDKLGPETRPVKVVIERNSEGDITAITENIDLITEEEEDGEIERIKNWAGGEAELAFAYKGTRTTFSVRVGECVPLESEELIVHYKDGRKQESKIRVFDTELCHRIYDFIAEGPEARATYGRDLNDKMASLFAEHALELIAPEDKEKEFLSNSKKDELINEFGNSPMRSLQIQILAGYIAGTQLRPLKQKKFGLSPIISAHMVLAECRYQGVSYFIDHPSFWPDKEESPTD